MSSSGIKTIGSSVGFPVIVGACDGDWERCLNVKRVVLVLDGILQSQVAYL
jgi:hypothetical protein